MTPARLHLVAWMLLACAAAPLPAPADDWTGEQVMQAVHVRQQQFPDVYEEQSIVLMDANGARDTRTARRYSRVEPDGSAHLLLVFETPPAVRGVALLAQRDAAGNLTQQLYLPALGPRLVPGAAAGDDAGFLGTDFSVESITGEMPARYRYARGEDAVMENVEYYTVDVQAPGAAPGELLRRHFVRKDNFFVTRTDFFDANGRVVRRQRAYDLHLVDNAAWHANLLLMDDYREQHQTLIKVDRRVYSRDYVPEEVFTAAWLFREYPAQPEDEVADAAPVASREEAP